jgi:hypothetical protein
LRKEEAREENLRNKSSYGPQRDIAPDLIAQIIMEEDEARRKKTEYLQRKGVVSDSTDDPASTNIDYFSRVDVVRSMKRMSTIEADSNSTTIPRSLTRMMSSSELRDRHTILKRKEELMEMEKLSKVMLIENKKEQARLRAESQKTGKAQSEWLKIIYLCCVSRYDACMFVCIYVCL